MSITSTKITISPVNLGNGHIGLSINGARLERQMVRNNGTLYWVPESISNLREIRVCEISDKWQSPFINAISIDGVIAVNIGVKVVNNTDVGITYDYNCNAATYSATEVTEECFRHCGQTVRRLYRDTPTVSRYVPIKLNINSMFRDSVLKEYMKIEGFSETFDKAFDIVETENTYRVYGWANNPDMHITFMKECAVFEIGGHGNRYDKPKRLAPFNLY